MTPDERWLAAQWPFVRAHLPQPPATVLEIGCGPLGGFVPALARDGYSAEGVDPRAPDGAGFRQVDFEELALARPVDAVVACTSLHHVVDLEDVVRRVAAALVPGGSLVVVEWARERFDSTTARWCFTRLAEPDDADDAGWLHRRRDEWIESGQPWDDFCHGWATREGLHAGEDILRSLDDRFERTSCACGPYFFADLDEVTEADEQAAIDAGKIQATGIRYAARA